MTLLGRAAECAVLEDLVADVRRGESRSLVLLGEAGIGKSALLAHLVASGSDLNVAQATGVESEMELPFAGLHQLCGPLLDGLEEIPVPQRDALSIVFGETVGPAPDRFLVGLAVLSLISNAAETRPLLCVVDDAQWLDRTSALALAFVARRLLAEPVGIVFAARKPGEELRHLPHLTIHGLMTSDAQALLSATVQFALDGQVRDRIVAETRGNPLALVELPRGLTPIQLAGGFGTPEAPELSTRIEQSYVRRVAALPDEARRLLLVAAAEPVGDPLLLRGACKHLEVEGAAVDATDGLLVVDEHVTFRHPLARSAVYWSADGAERRAAHLAIAEATDRDTDPDRRAWHLAAAAAEPDEEIAHELERSAGRAQARGGFAAAAAFLRRAVALTGNPARRAERALAAAEASLGAGAFDVARGLLVTADSGLLDELGRARVDRLLAEIAYAENRGNDAPPLLLQAAQKLETLDVRLSRTTYLEAWGAALVAGDTATRGGLREVSRAVASAPRPDGAVQPTDLLLDGLSLLFTEGRVAAAPVIRRAVASFASPDVSTDDLLRWGWLATRAANVVWDHDACMAIGRRTVDLARETGALETLALADNTCGQAAAFAGDFATASRLSAEVEAVRDATGTRLAPYAVIALAGLRGQEAAAVALLDDVLAKVRAASMGTAIQYVRWAQSVLFNGLGRYEEALTAATDAHEALPEIFISAWAASELIEAASRTERVPLACDVLARLEQQTDASSTDWALGMRARARAQLLDGDAAEESYREAIDRLARTQLRPDLARAHLLFGEWLRRDGRRRDARVQLRIAHKHFVEIGMEAFAERTRGELLATGERVRKRIAETRDDLTPQERQIAGLARDGLSNPTIGAQLFLSPRTVEWHLRKVFNKLGIHSRRELADALPDVTTELVPASPSR
ncbi:MAG: AAA family ATPase [Solirubrobacteraceae bacterium]|nr:AAA family ATPase [Solirubrobacteraceae bacterium]